MVDPMRWYYLVKGDAAKHGLADVEQLRALVKSGVLRPADLVWEETGGDHWTPASSIEGLFPESALREEAKPSAQAPTGVPARHARPRVMLVVLLALLAALVIAAFLALS
jgi:hypothetical protein